MAERKEQHKCIAVVRVRGTVSASLQARETLHMLHLIRNNYAVLVDDRPSFSGMLKRVRDYVTYGEVSKEMVNKLVKEKGRLAGNRKLSDEYVQKIGFRSLDDLSEAIQSCRTEYWKLRGIQPVFRLHPPTKGYKGSVKKGYGSGGELGYRGDKVDELLKRML